MKEIQTVNTASFTTGLIRFLQERCKCHVFCIALMLISYQLNASPAGYPISYKPKDLLKELLAGEGINGLNGVKWYATPGDVLEFNAHFSETGVLYSIIDTTFAFDREGEKLYYVIFGTAPMVTNEEGDFVNSNSCHVCGVNLGYFSYTTDNDSIYVNKFKRNFAVHGSFGEKSYTLSIINLGDAYDLLRVDDPYEGMGIFSVTTRFYKDGELVLSMISEENNSGNREKTKKGYYEFETDFAYSNKVSVITVKQTGYRIDEKSGKKEPINKTRRLYFDNYTLQF